MLNPATPLNKIRFMACRNAGASVLPAYGPVRITGIDADGTFTVDKANADSQDVFFLGPQAAAVGGYGVCTMDWPALAYYSTSDGTPAVGDEWGSASGDTKLRKGKTGYVFLAVVDSTNGVGLVRRASAAGGTSGIGQQLSLSSIPGGMSSISDSTWSGIDWAGATKTIDPDPYSFWDGHTALSAPTAGWYHINGQISWPPNGTGLRGINISINTGDIADLIISAYAGHKCSLNIDTIANLGQGDYAQIQVYQSSGGALGLSALLQFSMVKL